MASGTLLFDYAQRVKGGDLRAAQQDLALTTGLMAIPGPKILPRAPQTNLYENVARRTARKTFRGRGPATKEAAEITKDYELLSAKVAKKSGRKKRFEKQQRAIERSKRMEKAAHQAEAISKVGESLGDALKQRRMEKLAERAYNWWNKGKNAADSVSKAREAQVAIAAAETANAVGDINDGQGTIRRMQEQMQNRKIIPEVVEGIRAKGYFDPLIRGKY